MRKIALLLALVMMVSIPLSVHAATPRTINIRPSISYNGNIATCTARIVGNSTSDHLEATIKLWHGNSCIETWEKTGNGYIFFSETATVTAGNTYTLTVDLAVNSIPQDPVSISKKCG